MTGDNGSVRLSVVLPNFNHSAVVDQAIRAIATQVPSADEIIVVDDGSTDNSIEVLEGLRTEYPALRIARSEKNKGAINALNRGLQEARGKFVYFGAADDLTQPGLFAAMLAALDRHPQAAFACCEAIVVDTATGRTGYRPPVRPSYTEAFFEPIKVTDLLRHIDNWILTGTALVRRDVISGLGGFDSTLGAFGDSFLFRKLALTYGFCFVPQLGLTWRMNAGGLSRSEAADPAGSMNTMASAVARMRADSVFPLWYPAVFERRWRFAIGRIAAEARPMNRAVLMHICRGPIGQAVLNYACNLGGPLGRFVALAWLALRERPTSFIGLIHTRLSRLLNS